MSLITDIREQLVLPICASLDRIADALANGQADKLSKALDTAAAPAAAAPAKRGRPARVVSPDQVEPPTAAPAEPAPDYDKILTSARTIAAELLQKDQQARNSVYKDQLVTLWKELHPTGNGKLSGLPQEVLPTALERLKDIAA